MMYALDVACPVCRQPAGRRCRALLSNRSTDTHAVRHDAALIQARRHFRTHGPE